MKCLENIRLGYCNVTDKIQIHWKSSCKSLPACLCGCAEFAHGQLCCSYMCKPLFPPHSTGSFPPVSQFCNGLKSTKFIRYCLVTWINTFQQRQSFWQWCHWIIYCLGNTGPFINENVINLLLFHIFKIRIFQ